MSIFKWQPFSNATARADSKLIGKPALALLNILLPILLIVSVTHLHAVEQECEWISKHVKDAMPPPATVIVRQAGSPLPNRRDVFPAGPQRISLSIHHSADVLPRWRDGQRRFVESALNGFQLPIEFDNNSQDPHIVVVLFRKGSTTSDTPRLISQFQEIPHRAGLFPQDVADLYPMIFSRCYTSWRLTAEAHLSGITIFIPFERDTGELVANAQQCLEEGLLKAFGIGLVRDGWTPEGWTPPCDKCTATDIRMARILQDNNSSVRNRISAENMIQRLTGTNCAKK